MAYPFFLPLQQVLGAGGAGTLSYTVPQSETLTFNRLVFSSTGAFNITDIRDTAGTHYTNAGASNPIPSTVLANGANPNNNIGDFPGGLELKAGTGISIDIVDTSGAGNTVIVVLVGTRESA